MLAILAHLLLAPATLALTLAALITGRVSGWRPHWLAVPAGAGAIWTAAIGVRRAAAGYAALPRHVAGYLGPAHLPFPLHGHPARLLHLPAAFSAPGSWLPRQLPVALLVAAAEAAAIGWLGERWSASGRRAPRPGLIVALRRRRTLAALAGGDVVTRDGCALGLDTSSGRPAEITWAQAEDGVLAIWPDPRTAARACFPLAVTALRRRRPLVLIDLTGSSWLRGVLSSACAVADVPVGLFSASGPGCYEPLRTSSDPVALAAALIDWTGLSEQHLSDQQRRSCERRLADAVAAAIAGPAAAVGPANRIGEAALGRSGPGRLPAGSPAAILDTLVAELGQMPSEPAVDVLLGQLTRLRSSPVGRWLRPPVPAAAPHAARPHRSHPDSDGGDGRDGPSRFGADGAAAEPWSVVSVRRAVRERGAAAFSLDLETHGETAAMVARLALADVTAVLRELRDWRLRGDGLLWVHGCAAGDKHRLAELTELAELGRATGTAVLLSTVSTAAAALLAPAVGMVVAGGPMDREAVTAVAGTGQFLPEEDQLVTAELLARQRPAEFTLIDQADRQLLAGCRMVPGPWARAR